MSGKEFIERLYGELPNLFRDEDQLRELWGRPDTRKALLEVLAERGFGEAQLREMGRMIDAENSDVYDVLAYVAYAATPITREKRVATRRDDIVAPYDVTLQAFLDFVLVQYVQEGVGELDERQAAGPAGTEVPLAARRHRQTRRRREYSGGVRWVPGWAVSIVSHCRSHLQLLPHRLFHVTRYDSFRNDIDVGMWWTAASQLWESIGVRTT